MTCNGNSGDLRICQALAKKLHNKYQSTNRLWFKCMLKSTQPALLKLKRSNPGTTADMDRARLFRLVRANVLIEEPPPMLRRPMTLDDKIDQIAIPIFQLVDFD